MTSIYYHTAKAHELYVISHSEFDRQTTGDDDPFVLNLVLVSAPGTILGTLISQNAAAPMHSFFESDGKSSQRVTVDSFWILSERNGGWIRSSGPDVQVPVIKRKVQGLDDFHL